MPKEVESTPKGKDHDKESYELPSSYPVKLKHGVTGNTTLVHEDRWFLHFTANNWHPIEKK